MEDTLLAILMLFISGIPIWTGIFFLIALMRYFAKRTECKGKNMLESSAELNDRRVAIWFYGVIFAVVTTIWIAVRYV
ncbi:MAG: hypothetical protein IJF96_04120 [Firmicutes bacterium]|nr:hypothetical protein [Bacillota bacterium]